MNIPPSASQWCVDNGYGLPIRLNSVGGGCINNGARLETESGQTIFLKQNPAAPKDMFERETEGLLALSVDVGPKVPEPLYCGPKFLLLEDLSPGPPTPGYWEEFGRRLAALHDIQHDQFGFDHDNYLGSTPQPNPWTRDGYEFFEEHRLGFQAKLALQQGYLEKEDVNAIERIGAHLTEHIPPQPASLLHGDLWSGNAMTGASGEPAMIDPAAYYGWREAELGMTLLFGGFSEAFYRSYTESASLDDGWRDRMPLYNLYHLLNHLNLFGRSYYARVKAVIKRFQ